MSTLQEQLKLSILSLSCQHQLLARLVDEDWATGSVIGHVCEYSLVLVLVHRLGKVVDGGTAQTHLPL